MHWEYKEVEFRKEACCKFPVRNDVVMQTGKLHAQSKAMFSFHQMKEAAAAVTGAILLPAAPGLQHTGGTRPGQR